VSLCRLGSHPAPLPWGDDDVGCPAPAADGPPLGTSRPAACCCLRSRAAAHVRPRTHAMFHVEHGVGPVRRSQAHGRFTRSTPTWARAPPRTGACGVPCVACPWAAGDCRWGRPVDLVGVTCRVSECRRPSRHGESVLSPGVASSCGGSWTRGTSDRGKRSQESQIRPPVHRHVLAPQRGWRWPSVTARVRGERGAKGQSSDRSGRVLSRAAATAAAATAAAATCPSTGTLRHDRRARAHRGSPAGLATPPCLCRRGRGPSLGSSACGPPPSGRMLVRHQPMTWPGRPGDGLRPSAATERVVPTGTPTTRS
jgi:hypothetical protein